MKLSKLNLETTIDGFLDNSFFAVQPQKSGHRSGLDAILLAATIRDAAKGRVADLGSGSGVAGMAVAQRCLNVNVDLFELNPRMANYAHQSTQLAQNAHLQDRLSVFEADITVSGHARDQYGLLPNTYDHIISNPPYNDESLQLAPSEDKAQAHAMTPDMLLKWIKTAAYIATHKAELTLIMRPANLSELLVALQGRFGSIRVKPIQPVSGVAAILMLVRAVKGGKAPLELLEPVILRDHPPKEDGGHFTSDVEEILRGRACLEL